MVFLSPSWRNAKLLRLICFCSHTRQPDPSLTMLTKKLKEYLWDSLNPNSKNPKPSHCHSNVLNIHSTTSYYKAKGKFPKGGGENIYSGKMGVIFFPFFRNKSTFNDD